MIIEDVHYRVVFDSRGNETVECEVVAGEVVAKAMAPSGASTGSGEAVVVSPYRYEEIEEEVSKAIIGMSVFDQESVDEALRELDGTDNFSRIGGNFAITASLAVAKAAAEILGLPLYAYVGGVFAKELPYPLGNVIGGGRHAEGSTSIQEFLVIPVGAKTFFEAQRANAAVHKQLKKIFKERGIFAAKGDEGAWAAQISDEQAFEILSEAIQRVEDELGVKVRMGIDVAATELWDGERYVYSDRKLTTEEQIAYMAELADRYDLLYIEDPLHEKDFEGFAELTKQVKCMVCGDDIFVTNPEIIKKGIEVGAANTVLIKPNQNGTLSGTAKAVKIAKDNGYSVVVSHRSGETEDETLAHLAVAFNAKLIKTGVVGGERISKLNELIRIEELMDKPRMVMI
ncbi:phosphopyruvate hydratase [Archaeoglobus fulgidus]|uniref:Enolase n=2 Tax=Archaeoglobus fulgidus TaxID=2234 RepID=ENO_ARCFU|nr:phosphopyruvate hydratase [Archaeoglobus fulgidus]O29133.2 RecName: Full=Enolase; AltName: Full=2-phospho-D-glycerate hydro-lyase; AltName: Full=2-phosphoglycerate dehydratase [Archaeoglobus fulgidus DSM 4304]AIG98006.1 phosphopyruvate hydratase [Archaeoglobus fulgidus DSM 8774]